MCMPPLEQWLNRFSGSGFLHDRKETEIGK